MKLEDRLAPVYDEERVAATWRRISEARARRGGPRRWLRFAALPALAAAAAVIVVIATRGPERDRAPGALASVDRAIEVDPGARIVADQRREVALDDGSRLTLDPGARVQVLSNDGERFATLIEHGTIAFEVRPGGTRRWEIETRLATIEVVGTRFVVAQTADAVTIEVERGVVMVRGERVDGRVRRLTAGHRLVVRAAITAAAGAALEPVEPAPADDPAVDPAPEPVEPAAARVEPPPAGDDPAAIAPAAIDPNDRPSAAGVPPRARPATPAPRATRATRATRAATAEITSAIAEADRLRAHDPRAAAAVLERAIANHRDDAAAGLAAFTLGRLYLERLGQPVRAVELFRRVIDRAQPRALLEDAHARLVEALLASGDRTGAGLAFADYERKYPHSHRVGALRARLAADP